MTFNSAPWAIDGARTPAGLARLAAYASGGGRSGIIRPSDLKVTALSTPGQGVRISAGGAAILNGYLSNPDEAYVVSNPASHTVLAADMPPSSPSTSYYLVCIVIGDPEFDQTGHPFMPPGPLDPALAADFQYVRVRVIPCSAGTTRLSELGVAYPGYAVARLEVPPNTTTITNAMITDLRELSKPRSDSPLIMAQPQPENTETQFTSGAFTRINGYAPLISIPSWATRLQAICRVDSIVHFDPLVVGQMRMKIGTVNSAVTYYELPDTSGTGERTSLVAIWDADVSAWAGTSQTMTVEIARASGAGFLIAYSDTTVTFDMRFTERPI